MNRNFDRFRKELPGLIEKYKFEDANGRGRIIVKIIENYRWLIQKRGLSMINKNNMDDDDVIQDVIEFFIKRDIIGRYDPTIGFMPLGYIIYHIKFAIAYKRRFESRTKRKANEDTLSLHWPTDQICKESDTKPIVDMLVAEEDTEAEALAAIQMQESNLRKSPCPDFQRKRGTMRGRYFYCPTIR
jgi:hypothetical protein